MSEIDYQLALLLQHKYDQERRDCEVAKALQETFENEQKTQQEPNLNDSSIARSLQEQFEKEIDEQQPNHNLVYSNTSSKTSDNTSASLTDPSWEVVDPTPDIHNLFVAFSERFFWNRLGSVTVGWSKRMTSCAGVCTYRGRGGMCTIALSEPLLKLRPRKDLVETLLHEMIHAYLFVTHNNRDRDGHGPEFQKHMCRINQEAGTNITIYHSFHDEVRLYQQHWWRCSGPCQNWKPYFGTVRRVMNRAPGPNDKWWAEHARNCGGQFVKIKEPEKSVKKPVEVKKNLPDIRKYFNTSNNSTTVPHSSTTVNKTPSTSSNIVGFSDINRKNNTFIRNSSSTVVINKTSKGGPKSNLNKTSKPSAIQVQDKIKSTPSTDNNPDYSVVRNHWASKYSTNNSGNSASSNHPQCAADEVSIRPGKRVKTSTYANCPCCGVEVDELLMNQHLDECLNSVSWEKEDEPLCEETHCDNLGSTVKCLVCDKNISKSDLKKHLDLCVNLSNIFDVDNEPVETGNY
ncbi:unnamed protein product [Phyllotreta striolata]|uniref:Protein with SprT-like domain at the N terminus n=1 Tax=Phyllotreta striolata TaxID=444603 RepID=A0A9N9THX7_PHYSR|nr:unnamed protein product [Phyllotreta striolata]